MCKSAKSEMLIHTQNKMDSSEKHNSACLHCNCNLNQWIYEIDGFFKLYTYMFAPYLYRQFYKEERTQNGVNTN